MKLSKIAAQIKRDNYFVRICFLLRQLGIVLLIFQICRLAFFIVNDNYFSPIKNSYLADSFFYGLQYDISSIIKYNCLYILLILIPGISIIQKSFYRTVLNSIFITFNCLALLINLTDIEYFRFVNKRISYEFWYYSKTMNEEIIKLLPVYAIQYWYLLFVFAILTFILSLFRLKKNSFVISNVNHLGSIGKVVSFAILIIFLGMAARGFGKSSLNSSDIERIMPIEYGVLATNAPFMIMETFFKVNTVSSFPGSDIHTQFNPEKKYSSNKPFENQNVVIIILESFAKEYIGSLNNNKGSTPFLDSLISQGLICRNAYANGRTSLEALPAVLCSMPSLGERPIALSLDNHKQLNSIAEILSHEGYYTSFFYGARNGNLGINNFAREAGFQDYFGRNEYGLNAAVSPWGIFDEDFLLFAKTKMDSFREPFITCIITLSSHSPFVLPEKFQNKFRDQPTPQLRSIAYTDYCLKQFFKKASSGKWYNNTLFVLVADHTSYSYSVKYNSRIGMFAIPILYFHPNDHKLKGFYDNVTQQCDIKPSILQYLHYQKKFISFGSSIFSEKDEHYAVMRLLNQYQFIDNFNLIDINMKGELMRAYKYKEDELLINDLSNSVTNNIDNELLKFKAIINKTLN